MICLLLYNTQQISIAIQYEVIVVVVCSMQQLVAFVRKRDKRVHQYRVSQHVCAAAELMSPLAKDTSLNRTPFPTPSTTLSTSEMRTPH